MALPRIPVELSFVSFYFSFTFAPYISVLLLILYNKIHVLNHCIVLIPVLGQALVKDTTYLLTSIHNPNDTLF